MSPTVSVLVTTYNRSRLLHRAISGILSQTFNDFEVVVIDDCSTDDTAEVVAAFEDERIRYIRNDMNVGSAKGDRAHIKRFVYELMRGKYFVYHCDDDYWPFRDTLERQVKEFLTHQNVAFVMGNQLSQVLDDGEPSYKLTGDEALRRAKNSEGYLPNLFSKEFMTGEQFISEFAEKPTDKNRIAGATLYDKEIFIRSRSMETEGSKWQAGYEILIGPARFGNVIFIDEPLIVTEIRSSNASFRGTQLDHYFDCITSIDTAFDGDAEFNRQRKQIIMALSRTFMANTLAILSGLRLSLCDDYNISKPVMPINVIRIYIANRIVPRIRDISYFSYIFYLSLTDHFVSRRAPSRRARASSNA